MAEIKIYGTLKNDTAEPAAYGDQVWMKEQQKYLPEVLKDIELSSEAQSYRTMTEAEVRGMCENILK